MSTLQLGLRRLLKRGGLLMAALAAPALRPQEALVAFKTRP
jgi:hypothetical protein